ncbi:ARM repeat-containing protein [Podospora didyma]|uniref:ARM repeat-containing protein n=1 Tax=Podospora didyma TaxID=330526 RepID=A0AAE0P4U3_9PEZI|nr:ARM repeat-containing protein [Podospora didyma]
MAEPPSESRELELVEKLDFRIVLVANDEVKLQNILKTFLPPLLLKLGSPHASVRGKVVDICNRLKTFIESPEIVLPVAALLDQYKQADSSLIRYWDLVFIQHSVGRLDVPERRALIPKALRGIGAGPAASLATLFNVVFRLLADLKLPSRGSKEDGAFREEIGLGDPEDAKVVAEWLGKLLLLRLSSSGSVNTPGLTDDDIRFLTLGKPDTWNSAARGLNLAETRIKAANFLVSGAFTDEERFIPAIYAASTPDFRISELGDGMLKRTSVSLEDKKLVKKLFEAHANLPAPYRIRILGLLTKSEVSATFPDEILAVFRLNVSSQAGSSDAMEVDEQTWGRNPSGLELVKVYRALFEYINWVARIGHSKPDFHKIAAPLVEMLRDFVEGQGWPKPDNQSLDDVTLRSRAYETIGVLAKGTTMSSTERLALAGWLFRSLSEDPTPDVVVNVDGALSSLTSILEPPHSPEVANQLHGILLSYMAKQEEVGGVVRSARHAATKWANHCLPFSDIYARWIDILAVAGRRDERSDVVEEGQKGLDPWTYYAADGDKTTALPDWQDMAHVFFKEPIAHINADVPQGMDVDESSVFVNFPGDVISAFPIAVDYCKRVLFLAALKDFKLEPGWERQLVALVQSDLETRKALRSYLSSSPVHGEAVCRLLGAAFEGMVNEDANIAEQCARSFVDMASFAPKAVLGPLASRSGELLFLVRSNKKELRALGAKAFGILAAHPSNSSEYVAQSMTALTSITKTLKTAVGSELNAVEGAFLALAHLLSRQVFYGTGTNSIADVDLADIFPTLDSVSSATVSTQEALFDAYSQLWTAALHVAPGTEENKGSKEYISKAFIDPLVIHAKKGNEKSITALGRLAISLPVADDGTAVEGTDDILGTILEKLFSLYEIKQAESHFTIGEAITAAISCWDAEVVQLTIDVETEGTSYCIPKRSARVKPVLQKLLTDCKTTKPSLLKASGIWLFCLIQHCSHLEEIQLRLRECQAAFMRLLGARDELVQETASRGLALVYEKGDPDLKEDLVRDLVSAFTGTGPKLKVDQETELFEEGALPTGDGKSITSYKDIMNLANEVGDQSLVYKFMSLATNAATWSTRSAFGRFGLSNILSESEVDPKLYPKLYRYRFDPNQNVQKSMDDIWKALVKNPGAVLETHFDAIINDLLKSIIGKEWRVREASCAAISDLISGRPFHMYERYYQKIWEHALKVLDDVKTSVRNAALNLCMALSNTLVRQLEESGSTTSAKAMMNEALPFLLSPKGIESSAKDVQTFSTLTIIKIAKSGGKSLNPYIPTMVPHLLGLLSTIEPEAINYYYQRVGEDNKEKIDKYRTAMVAQSPITEAIENCLRSVDKEVMSQLAPRLEETIKTAIGSASKLGCSRVLQALATRHIVDFAPYAPRFLHLMEKQALDANNEIGQAYACAAAYIIRLVPGESKLRFVKQFIKLYLESKDEHRREKVTDVVLFLSKVSPDHFSALESELLPFAYLAKHDTHEYVRSGFKDVWDKRAGSDYTVTRYIPEIVGLVQKSMDTAQWALKHAGALTIASAVATTTSASNLTGQVNIAHLKLLWPVYEKALALKTFAGKEKLLEPLPDFASKGKELWQKDAQFGELLKKIALREAKRNNDEYRPHAFRCLWRFAAARDDLDLLPDIAAIVTPHLDLAEDPDAMEIDKPKAGKGRGLDPKTQAAWAAIEAVAKGFNRTRMAEDPYGELKKIVGALEPNASPVADEPFISGSDFDTIRRVYWYDCAAELLDTAAAAKKGEPSPNRGEESPGGQDVVPWFLATFDLTRADAGTEDQRLTRAKAVKSALELVKGQVGLSRASGGGLSGTVKEKTKASIEKALAEERSADVRAKWTECLKYFG